MVLSVEGSVRKHPRLSLQELTRVSAFPFQVMQSYDPEVRHQDLFLSVWDGYMCLHLDCMCRVAKGFL